MKKILPVAVMTALAGINAHAAVNINNDGTGQVLLYPFYTTEGGQDTYINIVNTTDQIKAVKVRVLESMNSVEVLDFNLYMSPEDHWSAVITADPAGEGAMMVSADNSCTVPNAMGQGVPIPFRNFEYAEDTLDNSFARTKEGYVEVIEMGEVDGTFAAPTGEDAPLDTFGKLLTFAINHTAAGVPGSCAVLEALWLSPDAWGGMPSVAMKPPGGGLYGYGVLIDVAEGTDATYDATALDDFSDLQLHTEPGLVTPSLGNGTDEYIVVNEGALVTGTATTGLDAVSATMMVANIANDYVLEPTISAGTDWVITFPTKNAYVNGILLADAVVAKAPFTSPWRGAVKPPGTPKPSCEAIGINYWDREEQGVTPGGLDFSPPPPDVALFALCAEANVLTFNSSNVLKASARSGADLAVIHDNGWARIDFTDAAFGAPGNIPTLAEGTARELATDGATFEGLPALGFAVQKYVNGDVGGTLSNYAGSVTHKGTRSITSGAND